MGDSTATPHEQPQPVRGSVRFTQIDVFFSHSCGLATDGRAWCWGGALFHAGGPNYPELCRADAFNTGSPCSLIPRLHSDSVFDAITVGGSGGLEGHVCGLSPDGSAYCWGGNFDGQLGDGTTSSTSEPVPVGGGLRFASLSAGNSHTCGITVGGITYCWGSNSNGQLGAPAVTGALTPVPVSGGTTYVQVLAGSFHTCGRTLGGIVECWGWNEGGQLGNGTIGDRSVPTRISGQ